LEGPRVEDVNDLLGLSVWHIGEELERILERRYDKGIVVCEGSLGEIETDTACVDDDKAGGVFTGFVYDDGGECGLEETEEVAVCEEGLAVLTIGLR
jgi:hypothetical protein